MNLESPIYQVYSFPHASDAKALFVQKLLGIESNAMIAD
jgi:hypothetical protein